MIEPTDDRRQYRTDKDLNIAGFDIPKGFEFDGMTIPWWLRSFVGGEYRPRVLEAVMIHDWLYTHKLVERSQADWIFYRVLKKNGVTFSYLFFLAVRVFGRKYFLPDHQRASKNRTS